MNQKNKEDKITKRLKEIAVNIKKHNILYHQKDSPEITDGEFDKLVKENNELEKKYPHLILKESPNNSLGAELSPHLRSVRAAINGTQTPKQRLPSGKKFSCIDLKAAADAVLQASITRSQPSSHNFSRPLVVNL